MNKLPGILTVLIIFVNLTVLAGGSSTVNRSCTPGCSKTSDCHYVDTDCTLSVAQNCCQFQCKEFNSAIPSYVDNDAAKCTIDREEINYLIATCDFGAKGKLTNLQLPKSLKIKIFESKVSDDRNKMIKDAIKAAYAPIKCPYKEQEKSLDRDPLENKLRLGTQ